MNEQFWEGNEGALRSGYNGEGRIPGFQFRLAGTILEKMAYACIQSQGFSAYCFKIRQSNKFIVVQVARFSRLYDFLTKLILNILVDGKEK
jgi:hypothetical protein